AHFIFQAANNSAQGYTGLTLGAANLIIAFGNQTLIDTYVPKMYAGNWQGTMALTEPQAGSSLSDIVTIAEPNNDGSYNISGQKIFISGGEHLACDNFVHLTLARIEGAPAGTKGISLFLIPKFLPGGNDLTFNNVTCVGDFQKLGQKGYATTHLAFGDEGPCKGYLLGEVNQGLSYMFQMMNEARIMVGQTAAAVASAAYYASLHYAQERPQGRKIEDKDPTKQQTLIINHADVRRMLLLQKAIFEGAMSLGLECLRLVDMHKAAEDPESMADQMLLLELLTPIMKTYPSEMGIQSVSNALQVLGGYGYTMDFDLQQYYRDIRIMSIYEGTTGIQSIDLLGRKMIMKNGRAAKLLIDQMQSSMDQASAYDALKPYVKQLGKGVTSLVEVIEFLKPRMEQSEIERFLADANIFMELASNLVIAWQWLKQGLVAQQHLLKNTDDQLKIDFYESKVHTMKFYFKYELPKIYANAATLMNAEELTIKGDKEILN
ncbi:MAG: acyl-CoA dehydrogenase, partial [Cyclobacteriaceae bacterium]